MILNLYDNKECETLLRNLVILVQNLDRESESESFIRLLLFLLD